MNQLTTRYHLRGQKNLSEEKIIHEILDQQNRTNNFIVHNMLESTATTKEEAMRKDIDQFLNVVTPQGINNFAIKNCIRLGKKSTENHAC